MTTAYYPPEADPTTIQATYVLPLRAQCPQGREFSAYLTWLSQRLEVVVVDASNPEIFRVHDETWPRSVVHCPPGEHTRNGKVAGVLTGIRIASHDCVIVADDDVRYDHEGLCAVTRLLDEYEVVRPQNYYLALPWHARLDTARSLLNRCMGGDWPGTIVVRRSVLLAAGGYDGDVLFENLELVRTVRAVGGREAAPLDVYVGRIPPPTRHFASQRVRQAYDELARPERLIVQLAVVPLLVAAVIRRRAGLVSAFVVLAVIAAEWGRRRGRGSGMFPLSSSLLAPLWIVERGVCVWLAVGSRLLLGGVRYHGEILRVAANSTRELRRRHAHRLSLEDAR